MFNICTHYSLAQTNNNVQSSPFCVPLEISTHEWEAFPASSQCIRIAYTGEPLSCCFRDYVSQPIYDNCFSPDNLHTCSPNNQDITSVSCQDTVGFYCNDPNDANWKEKWDPTCLQVAVRSNSKCDCLRAIYRNIYGVNTKLDTVTNLQGFLWAKNLVDSLFRRYASEGYVIGSAPGTPTYHPFQETLKAICTSIPGICENALNQLCVSRTINDLILAPSLLPWCGCHLPDSQYQRYNQFNINKECTPICAQIGNIPTVTGIGSNFLTCTQNICLIDDVTINLANSKVGSLNLQQVCGGCSGSTASGTQTCQCIIQGTDIISASSQIGHGIDLRQVCGNNPTCFRIINGNQTPVPCDMQPNDNQEDINNWLIVTFIILFFLVLLLIYNSK